MKKHKILALITALLLIASSAWAAGPVIYGVSGPMDGVESLTDGGVLVGNGTDAIQALSVMTNGQLLIGDGATDPAIASLTGTASQITISLFQLFWLMSFAEVTILGPFFAVFPGFGHRRTTTRGKVWFQFPIFIRNKIRIRI